MIYQLVDIISEIEDAQRSAKARGRRIATFMLSHDEILEFKQEYAKRRPDCEDRDNLFKGETFWKGSRIKPG